MNHLLAARMFVQYGAPLDGMFDYGVRTVEAWIEADPEEAAARLALFDRAEAAITSGGPVERVDHGGYMPEWALRPRSPWRERYVAYDFRTDDPVFIFKEDNNGDTTTVAFAPTERSSRTLYSQWTYTEPAKAVEKQVA